jgi:hypothetical protein
MKRCIVNLVSCKLTTKQIQSSSRKFVTYLLLFNAYFLVWVFLSAGLKPLVHVGESFV